MLKEGLHVNIDPDGLKATIKNIKTAKSLA